jgi:hypothetical protein
MKPILILFLLPLLSSAQNKFDFARYASVLVNPKGVATRGLSEESFPLTSNAIFPLTDTLKPTLYIPVAADTTIANGNRYMQAYLINGMPDPFKIDRCDATIYPAETQILVNGEWKTFQVSITSICGNSYFASMLPPKSFYNLWIEVKTSAHGTIPTQFRLKLRMGNTDYFSNSHTIYLTKEETGKAGTKIEPLAL